MSDFAIVATGDHKITITRSFDAPVAHVLKAHLEPDMLMQWMAVPGIPLTVCEVDARVSGGFHHVWKMPDGGTMQVNGTYLEMDMAPSGDGRTLHTEVFEPDWTGGPTTVETTYATVAAGTTVTTTITYASTAVRDRALASDMAASMAICYAQLDAVLAA